MPNEHITNAVCHTYREEMYRAIFPRWALLLVILLVAGMIATLYAMNGKSSVAAADALKKAENNDTKFSIEIKHTNAGVARLEIQFATQQKLLIKIDKKIPDDPD